jgi:hypothetical protein
MREGCEKAFHAYVEACSALIQKRGLPEPGDHLDRRDTLDKIGERKLIEIGDSAFLHLYRYAYYGFRIYPEADKALKDVEEAISYS